MADTPLTKHLRMLRKRDHYTQSYVAKYIGTTRANYSHYETGLTRPSNDVLEKLSRLYKYPLIDLVRLSAISDSEKYKRLSVEGKAGFDGMLFDNPASSSLDPLYVEFINNCEDMTDRELKKWMDPDDIELVYYYHLLSPKGKMLATEGLRLLVKSERRNED